MTQDPREEILDMRYTMLMNNMDDHLDWDEIEFLSSMYCQPGEFNVQGETVTLINNLDMSKEIGTSAESDIDAIKVPIKMVFRVGPGYPKILPDISIYSEHLNDESISKIKSHVYENIGPDFLDMPMLLPISALISDAARVELATVFRNRGPPTVPCDETGAVGAVGGISRSDSYGEGATRGGRPRSDKSLEDVSSKRPHSVNNGEVMSIGGISHSDKEESEGATSSGTRDSWSAVLQIDHMRSKNKYCKTLEKWASQLALTGRIVFLRRLILVLLQGCQENVKDFIIRLKTCTVDVDSKGHACKEKMMKVLSEGVCKSSHRLAGFTRCELTKESVLRDLISESSLDGHWENIMPVLKQHR